MKTAVKSFLFVWMFVCANFFVFTGYIFSTPVRSNPPPPDDSINGVQYIEGNWEVTGNETYTNETIILTGNLTIKNGGKLSFHNVTLKIYSVNEGDSEFRIQVESGGQLYIYDYDNDNATTQDASIITTHTDVYYYLFYIYDGAKVVMRNSELSGCRYKTYLVEDSGIHIYSDDVFFDCNIIRNNYIGILLEGSSATINNNTITGNRKGVHISGGSPIIFGNRIVSNFGTAIFCDGGSPLIDSNIISSNGWFGGIAAMYSSPLIINTTIIFNSGYGIEVWGASSPTVINSTISESSASDIWLDDGVHLTLLNTQFNESSVIFDAGAPLTTTLTVQWYMDIYVNNTEGAPVGGANAEIHDLNNNLVETRITDAEGVIKCVVATEYTQTPVGIVFLTPHNVTAGNVNSRGYAIPEPIMDETKHVNITLTPIPVPSAPTGLTATAGDSYVNITWSAPASDGGYPLINYTIYRGTSSGEVTFLTEIGNVSYYNDTPVINGITYYYNIAAVNIIGEGPSSEEINATPVSVPDAPIGLTATAGDSYVNITWDAPTLNGGFPIINYEIYKGTTSDEVNYLVEIGNITQFNDTTVSNGVTYYYKVSARNAMGEGALADEVNATPSTTPSAPTGLTVTAGDSYIYITWNTPELNGGFPITNYHIYRDVALKGETFLAEIGNITFYKDMNVINGVTYYYKVCAVNIVGEGPLSNEESATPQQPSGEDEGVPWILIPISLVIVVIIVGLIVGYAINKRKKKQQPP